MKTIKKSNVLTRLIALPLSIILCIVLLKEKTDITAILSTIYTINLFINILFTIKDIGINNFFPTFLNTSSLTESNFRGTFIGVTA